MIENWWVEGNHNFLEGDPNDSSNPIVLEDDFIIEFLQSVPQARTDYLALFPTLSLGAQSRLNALIDANPMVNLRTTDEQEVSDQIQRSWNTAGIYTCGPRGGGN